MAKKLVFSGYKFLERELEAGTRDEEIDFDFTVWATECEGLTEKEMNAIGYLTSHLWMVEVDA